MKKVVTAAIERFFKDKKEELKRNLSNDDTPEQIKVKKMAENIFGMMRKLQMECQKNDLELRASTSWNGENLELVIDNKNTEYEDECRRINTETDAEMNSFLLQCEICTSKELTALLREKGVIQ